MLTKKVKKLWKGRYVSIRDYDQKKAMTKGGLRLEHNGEVMELPPQELRLYRPKGVIHQSKTGGQSYQLIDIEWKSITTDPRQERMDV
jgi:hypothetical protein